MTERLTVKGAESTKTLYAVWVKKTVERKHGVKSEIVNKIISYVNPQSGEVMQEMVRINITTGKQSVIRLSTYYTTEEALELGYKDLPVNIRPL